MSYRPPCFPVVRVKGTRYHQVNQTLPIGMPFLSVYSNKVQLYTQAHPYRSGTHNSASASEVAGLTCGLLYSTLSVFKDFHLSVTCISCSHRHIISELLLPQVSLPQTSLCPPPSQEEGADEQALWRGPPGTVPEHGQVWSETGMMWYHLKHETNMSDFDCEHRPLPFRSLHTTM